MSDEIETKINKLLTDPDFLELVNFQNRPDLFSTLAASHTEMWHSAFVKWLIDPASHLGLGPFPLRRFLFAVMHVGRTSLNTRKPGLSLGDLEDMVLDDIEFGTEFSFRELGNKRIDIIGVLEEVPLTSRRVRPLQYESSLRTRSRQGKLTTRRAPTTSLQNVRAKTFNMISSFF